jgi:hypothetical protein
VRACVRACSMTGTATGTDQVESGR